VVLSHIQYPDQKTALFDRYLITAIKPYACAWRLLQTLPGIDQIGAVMILIEIGDDMRHLGSASRLASYWLGNHSRTDPPHWCARRIG
jgi:transposase